MAEIKGVLQCKAGSGLAFKMGDEWYDVKVEPALTQLKSAERGKTYLFVYDVNGKKKIVSSILSITVDSAPETKYPNTPPPAPKSDAGTVVDKGNKYNPDIQERITRGNAANAAGAALSGNFSSSDPEALAEALIILALRIEKYIRG
jgi:hypothetical protein